MATKKIKEQLNIDLMDDENGEEHYKNDEGGSKLCSIP